MTGWDCVVSGTDRIEIAVADDLRTFTFKFIASDGTVEQHKTILPALIYRGIWKEGDAYARGDSATRDGSMWVLMAEQQKGKPGDEGSGWVLSTKRGRDGRDGLRGETGERGAEGRPGKDLTQLGFDGSKH
jgi:integrin beta 3